MRSGRGLGIFLKAGRRQLPEKLEDVGMAGKRHLSGASQGAEKGVSSELAEEKHPSGAEAPLIL